MALPTYRNAQSVTLVIPCKDANGAAISANSATYRILDASGSELQASLAVPGFTTNATQVSVTVSAGINTLSAGLIRDMRVIEVTLTSGSTNQIVTGKYVVETDIVLQIMVNTFQTLDQAELQAIDMVGLQKWGSKSDTEKRAAMIMAFEGLCGMQYHIQTGYQQNMLNWRNRRVYHLREYTVEEFTNLYQPFVEAIRKAQVAEADNLLNGDITASLRRAGIISYTIGETSQFLRPAKALELPVSKQALAYLSGYMDYSVRISRG